MSAVLSAPVEVFEEIAALKLPAKTDLRLQNLMDRNNNGALNSQEKEDLEDLVELNETLSLVRAKALHLLGRKPT